MDKAAYTMCVLEQFHRHLEHRSIFAVDSQRWRDPRAHLLDGAAWESARERGMNALNQPTSPTGILAEHVTAVDAAYRELAARLGEDNTASIDAEGRLHVAALEAKPEPASLIDLRNRVAAMCPRSACPSW